MWETSQRKGTLPSISNRSKSTQGKQHQLQKCREEDLGWTSCESEAVAVRSGRGGGELLKFQGDLDLHVWKEIDPKFTWKSSREFLQNARSSNFGESKLDVRPNSARPNSGRPISKRSSNSGEIRRSSKLLSVRPWFLVAFVLGFVSARPWFGVHRQRSAFDEDYSRTFAQTASVLEIAFGNNA
ncbi:hypothetical protein LR48_Vigan07g037700 [Vigna angularis]|uniref:Uncharacterized protein n=1 Tax=Phaseolus angularis TaxID=3914 RepID=A0A0L9UV83_PHAAN|nr:hypothetical protein LR48_Vigan07g037700 [Vigna angularis]